MDAKSISDILDGKSSGKGYMACCPAHDDKNPSLSISESDGIILLKCWSGCSVESIVSAIGIEMKDLFPDSNLTFEQRNEYNQKRNKTKLWQALYRELMVLVLIVGNRYTDKILDRDTKFKEVRPEFKCLPDEFWEHELQAVRRVKRIIGDLYGI